MTAKQFKELLTAFTYTNQKYLQNTKIQNHANKYHVVFQKTKNNQLIWYFFQKYKSTKLDFLQWTLDCQVCPRFGGGESVFGWRFSKNSLKAAFNFNKFMYNKTGLQPVSQTFGTIFWVFFPEVKEGNYRESIYHTFTIVYSWE